MRSVYVASGLLLLACCCWEYYRVVRWLRAASEAVGEGPAGSVRLAKKPLDTARGRHHIDRGGN